MVKIQTSSQKDNHEKEEMLQLIKVHSWKNWTAVQTFYTEYHSTETYLGIKAKHKIPVI